MVDTPAGPLDLTESLGKPSPISERLEVAGIHRAQVAQQEPLDHGAHRLCAEHERFLAAAAVEHTVGEDVAAVQIRPKLHFIYCEERHVEIPRHRLDR